ncbi:hypothetical protein D3C78_1610500 [compost metagenome]
MTVDAIGADVQLATGEPGRVAVLEIIALDGLPGRHPVEKARSLLGPEFAGVFDGFFVEPLVLVLTQLRSPADGIGLGVLADIEHDGSLFLFCDKI